MLARWISICFLLLSASVLGTVGVSAQAPHGVPWKMEDAEPYFAAVARNEAAQPGGKNLVPSYVYRLVEVALYDLGHYTQAPVDAESSALSEAIRRFQGVLGEEPTGVLLVRQQRELGRRWGLRDASPIASLPPGLKIAIEASSARADGSWYDALIEEGQPFNRTSIRCDRRAATCVEATTIVRRASGQSAVALDVVWSHWFVKSWSAEEVVAFFSPSACAEETLVIRAGFVNRYRNGVNSPDCPPGGFSAVGLTDGEMLSAMALSRLQRERDSVRDPRFQLFP